MKCRPIPARLRVPIAPLLITGAMGTALVVASSTTSVPVSETGCMSGGGNVHAMGTTGSTVTAALAPARPVAAQIPANTCPHPCDGLYNSQIELCSSKDSRCMSRAADRHGDCLSAYK
jgi:hypothetical protein